MVNNVNNCVFLCVLMLCTFYYDVVTAVCQLLINEYVMLCYVVLITSPKSQGIQPNKARAQQ